MKPQYWGMIAFVVLIGAGYLVWDYASRPRTLKRLTADALSAAVPAERSRAVVELSMRKEPETREALRRLAAESMDPEVEVVALTTLAERNDRASLPLFIAAMDNPEEAVRVVAHRGVLRFYGGALPDDLQYSPKDNPDERSRVTSKLLEIYESPPPVLH